MPRFQFWRSLSLSHRALHRDVSKLGSVNRAAQEQTATAHVSPADKLGRKTDPFRENIEQDAEVLSRSHAAE